ncbi:hypothetical protein Pcinc_030655 [Petrolisthes cinctipes]|uniref:Uncharacterized protein n=1 Tax=Petrolisthes cinctipes TaxID=88211 RepID=A0AAE1EXP1_PETCI|nr:hypothetical protein Pcinc_030655 [Petrolisthes cinctipes]
MQRCGPTVPSPRSRGQHEEQQECGLGTRRLEEPNLPGEPFPTVVPTQVKVPRGEGASPRQEGHDLHRLHTGAQRGSPGALSCPIA